MYCPKCGRLMYELPTKDASNKPAPTRYECTGCGMKLKKHRVWHK